MDRTEIVDTARAAMSAAVRVVATGVGHAGRAYGSFAGRRGSDRSRARNEVGLIEVDGVPLRKRFVTVDGYRHLVTEAGDPAAEEAKTIVMMGGVPTDSSETLHWMTAALCRRDPALRCVILHLPFMEESNRVTPTVPARYSTLDGIALPFKTPIDLSGERLDVRFDHRVQAEAAHKILQKMDITSAHLVGHDRGAVVFDHLIVDQPLVARSYSRGAQLWDHYDEEWAELAPNVIVGPPHRLMVEPWQCRALFLAVIRIGRPIALLSPGFLDLVGDADPGTEGHRRRTLLTTGTLAASSAMLTKMRQTFMQTDTTMEVALRAEIKKTYTPIMQFQGEDEYLTNERGTLVSDQPYFGIYNLFPNDVEDLYPGAVGQDPALKRHDLLTDRGAYQLLRLKPSARLARFALIPRAAHFNVVENPSGCAAAIHDFVVEMNKV